MAMDSRHRGPFNTLTSFFSGAAPSLPTHQKLRHDDPEKQPRSPFPVSLSFRDITRQFPSSHRRLIPRNAPLTAPPSVSISASTSRFVLLCALWYTSSALSSNTGKAIMTTFRYPVTLTFVQFGFVAFYCLLFMSPLVRFTTLRPPTRAIIRSTLPMGMFQVGGHMFSSMAISRIPVSTVHTIKALSPLFTVAAYALLFGVSYSPKTYFSLLPLTLGVMLACSFDVSASNATGLLCAFGSALVFVSSNIFFKKIMPSPGAGPGHGPAARLDKLNLLLYSSGMAFVLMFPLWLYYDLPAFLAAATDPAHVAHPGTGHATHTHGVLWNFLANGTVHFAQNIIAFVILASTSPVTYSIASLVKRVAVICIAVVWFAQPVHPVQALGIALTGAGLWAYHSAKGDVAQGEQKMRRVEAAREGALPTTLAELTEEEREARDRMPEPVPTTTATRTATGTGRPRAPSLHRHAPPPPPLKIVPPPQHGAVPESYPSPPPSLDSPPAQNAPLGHVHAQ